MAFSSRTVTHIFINPDQTPGAGTVEFQLMQEMTNDGTTILPGSVVATINGATGAMSQAITPNDDVDTFPKGVEYTVTFRLQAQGSSPRSYIMSIPAGSGNLDLGSLLPEASQPIG